MQNKNNTASEPIISDETRITIKTKLQEIKE